MVRFLLPAPMMIIFMGAGRPLKFQSVEELQSKIDAYFASKCDDEGNVVKPISITGLALWLDTSRETLCDYQEKDEFSDTIKKAKLRVENFYEERLTFSNATGSIFALKNFDWKDKTETDHTSGGEKIRFQLNLGAIDKSDDNG